LSDTIIPGLPRRSIRVVSSRATRRPEIEGEPSSRHRFKADGERDRCQAFPRDVIHHIQHPKPPPAGKLIVDEVQRPARIGPRLDQDWGPCANGLAARFAFTDG
jgi:hypothetical protein